MSKTPVQTKRLRRVSQGDILREVECIEYVVEKRGTIEVSKIVYPLVVVMTQDCDLEQDARYKTKNEQKPKTDDKRLISALVVPIYNAEHVYTGSHLSDLNLTMTPINANKTPGDYLRLNERPRYHYLEFDDQVRLVSQIADFKHYFSVNLLYLEKIRASNFVCRISEIFREDMSLRFAAYLARIGLPSELQQARN